MKWKRNTLLTIGAGMLWLLAIGAGFTFLENYSNESGPDGNSPVDWPAESRIRYDRDRPTLIMFAHPHCPCTRASIGELALIAASCKDQVTIHIVFFTPVEFATTWAQTDLWESADHIPGVIIDIDDGGTEARRFRAATSGQTVLYSREGKLLFGGGITGSRGHSGDNPGRDAVVSLLKNKTSREKQTPVFGCSLTDSTCSIGDPICSTSR